MQPCQHAFEAIGTHWVIDIYDLPFKVDYASLLKQLQKRIETFDKHYSRFRHDSLVMEMALKAGRYHLPDDAPPLLDLYEQLYGLTDGQMTPLIGQTLEQAGYDAHYSLIPGRVERPPSWSEVLHWKKPNLTLKQPALLDFGAAGKGYLIDIVAEILTKNGIDSFCVDAGGDIVYISKTQEPLRVGLEHPGDTTQVIGVAELPTGKSICASAGNRRRWGPYHHILNPHTLQSPTNIIATWVIADNALTADGLATALFFVEPERLVQNFNFAYVIVNDANKVAQSENFPGQLFS